MGSQATTDQLQTRTRSELFTEVNGPTNGGKPPVLLIHGFASSSELNWHKTGWVTALTGAGRRVITVDLPAHGNSPAAPDAENNRPSRMAEVLRAVLVENGVLPLSEDNPGSGADVVGYSLGSRLAWELAAAHPDVIRRLVLGGPSRIDPLAQFQLEAARRFLESGEPVQHAETAELLQMAQLVPGNNVGSLLDVVEQIQTEPFNPADAVPAGPMLLVAGDKDLLAASMPDLAGLSPLAEMLWLPARSHTNAVSSRAFKTAALQFLN